MDNNSEQGQLSPRRSYCLGQQSMIESTEIDVSPVASHGMSFREEIATPLQPATTIPILRQSQASQETQHLNMNNDLAMTQEIKIPSPIFGTKNAPIVPTGKSGYKHLLTKKGQPGNRLITAGILSSKTRSSSLRPMALFSTVISTQSPINQNAKNKDEVHNLHDSNYGQNLAQYIKNDPAKEKELASPTSQPMSVLIKNGMLATMQQRQQAQRQSIASSNASNSIYQGPTVSGIANRSRMRPRDFKDLFVSASLSPSSRQQQNRGADSNPTSPLQPPSAQPKMVSRYIVNTDKMNTDLSQIIEPVPCSREDSQLLILGVMQRSSDKDLETMIAESPQKVKNVAKVCKYSGNVTPQRSEGNDYQIPTHQSSLGETRLGQHNTAQEKSQLLSMTGLPSPPKIRDQPSNKNSTLTRKENKPNNLANKDLHCLSSAVSTIQHIKFGENSSLLSKTDSAKTKKQTIKLNQEVSIKVKEKTQDQTKSPNAASKSKVAPYLRLNLSDEGTLEPQQNVVMEEIPQSKDIAPLNVLSYKKTARLANAPADIGFRDGWKTTVNSSMEMQNRGIIIQNNPRSLNSPQRVAKQPNKLSIEHILKHPRIAIYEQLQRHKRCQSNQPVNEKALYPKIKVGALNSSDSDGQSTIAFQTREINTGEYQLNDSTIETSIDGIQQSYLQMRTSHNFSENRPVVSEKPLLQTSVPGYRQFPGNKKILNNRNTRFDSINNQAAMIREVRPSDRHQSVFQTHAIGFNSTTRAPSQLNQTNYPRHRESIASSTQQPQKPSQQAQINSTLQKHMANKTNAFRLQSAAHASFDSAELCISGQRSKNAPPLNQTGRLSPLVQSVDLSWQVPLLLVNPFKSIGIESNPLDSPNSKLLLETDISRSAIPIDQETSKHMKMQLPQGFDGSDYDQKSRSRDKRSKDSFPVQGQTPKRWNADLNGHFTKVKTFAMSPKEAKIVNKQKAVNQVKKILAEQAQEKSSNEFILCNAATQQSELRTHSRLSQVKEQTQTYISTNSDVQQTPMGFDANSQKHNMQSDNVADKLTPFPTDVPISQSVVLKESEENKAEKINTLQSQPSEINSPRNELKNSVLTYGNVESLLASGQANSQQTSMRDQKSSLNNAPNNNQGARINSRYQKTQHGVGDTVARDVAILVNKINIQVNQERDKANQIDANASNMTDYRLVSNVTDYSNTGISLNALIGTDTKTTQKRIYQPVLKQRSYRLPHNKNMDYHMAALIEEDQVVNQNFAQDKGTGDASQKQIAVDAMLVNECDVNSNRERQVVADLISIGESHSKELMMLMSKQNSSDIAISSQSQFKPNSSTNVVLGQMEFDFSKFDLEKSDDEQDQSISEEADSELVAGLLKLDVQGRAMLKQPHNRQEFVNQKTREFLKIQEQMPKLDHNTGVSEYKNVLNNKADFLLKNIALTSSNTFAPEGGWQRQTGHSLKSNSLAEEGLFDLNQKRSLHIMSVVPTSMIKFKNKSEQQRYLRIAKCILQLHAQEQQTQLQLTKNKADVEFTYMKIFRFLADILSNHEFDSLSYYHVSSFIQSVLKITIDQDENDKNQQQISLRQFVCQSLDLRYDQTKMSKAVFDLDKNMIQTTQGASLVKPLWHETNQKLDLSVYADRKLQQQNKPQQLNGGAAERHAIIHDKIRREAKTQASEPGLPSVMRSQDVSKGKETLHRGNVARLLKVNKRQLMNDIGSDQNLWKESTIARNKVMLEHVMAKRNLESWRVQVMSELHEENRIAQSVDASRRCQGNERTQ